MGERHWPGTGPARQPGAHGLARRTNDSRMRAREKIGVRLEHPSPPVSGLNAQNPQGFTAGHIFKQNRGVHHSPNASLFTNPLSNRMCFECRFPLRKRVHRPRPCVLDIRLFHFILYSDISQISGKRMTHTHMTLQMGSSLLCTEPVLTTTGRSCERASPTVKAEASRPALPSVKSNHSGYLRRMMTPQVINVFTRDLFVVCIGNDDLRASPLA